MRNCKTLWVKTDFENSEAASQKNKYIGIEECHYDPQQTKLRNEQRQGVHNKFSFHMKDWQLDIRVAIASGNNTIAVVETSFGKSLLF